MRIARRQGNKLASIAANSTEIPAIAKPTGSLTLIWKSNPLKKLTAPESEHESNRDAITAHNPERGVLPFVFRRELCVRLHETQCKFSAIRRRA